MRSTEVEGSDRVGERGVFLGWFVISGDEGAEYQPGHIAKGGNSTELSAETWDKEELNNEHTLVGPQRHICTLGNKTTSTGRHTAAHVSFRKHFKPLVCVDISHRSGVLSSKGGPGVSSGDKTNNIAAESALFYLFFIVIVLRCKCQPNRWMQRTSHHSDTMFMQPHANTPHKHTLRAHTHV